MPARFIAATLLLAVSPGPAVSDEVVTATLDIGAPDPAVTAHLRVIPGPITEANVTLKQPDSSRIRMQAVSIKGSISTADVITLIQDTFPRSDEFWRTPPDEWAISVVGDDKYAAVFITMVCGLECGYRHTYW
jgi:hypothetical protein